MLYSNEEFINDGRMSENKYLPVESFIYLVHCTTANRRKFYHDTGRVIRLSFAGEICKPQITFQLNINVSGFSLLVERKNVCNKLRYSSSSIHPLK